MSVDIKVYPNEKNSRKQPPGVAKYNIPKAPMSMIINGRSGSGKSNLVINLLSNRDFYAAHHRLWY